MIPALIALLIPEAAAFHFLINSLQTAIDGRPDRRGRVITLDDLWDELPTLFGKTFGYKKVRWNDGRNVTEQWEECEQDDDTKLSDAIGYEAAMERKNVADAYSEAFPDKSVEPYTHWEDAVSKKQAISMYVTMETWFAARIAGIEPAELELLIWQDSRQLNDEWKHADQAAHVKPLTPSDAYEDKHIEEAIRFYQKWDQKWVARLKSGGGNPDPTANVVRSERLAGYILNGETHQTVIGSLIPGLVKALGIKERDIQTYKDQLLKKQRQLHDNVIVV